MTKMKVKKVFDMLAFISQGIEHWLGHLAMTVQDVGKTTFVIFCLVLIACCMQDIIKLYGC